MLGSRGCGLALAHLCTKNRIRQAASSLGAAQSCVNESVAYARERKPFGEELAKNQGIQFSSSSELLVYSMRNAPIADLQNRLGNGQHAP